MATWIVVACLFAWAHLYSLSDYAKRRFFFLFGPGWIPGRPKLYLSISLLFLFFDSFLFILLARLSIIPMMLCP